MIFGPEQVGALRTLARVWSTQRFVLIGASALSCQIGMSWRETHDLDLVLAVRLEDYPAGLEKESGWTRHPNREHRWVGPGDVQVDVIPAAEPPAEEAVLRWPLSGLEMNLLGLRLAFKQAVAVEVAAGLTVRTAPVEVVTLLKMVAYLDRPHERDRDLADIAYILDEYVPASDDRRYSEAVLEVGLTHDEISPFLLGRRLSAIVNEEERKLILRFLGRVTNARDPAVGQARMLSVAPASWQRDPEALLSRIMAFERGLGSDASL